MRVSTGPEKDPRLQAVDRGAAAVEFALILPLFVVLVFGVIGGAQVLEQKLSLSHAAREGSRFGATFPTPNDPNALDAWLTQVADVAAAAADDDLAASVPGRYVCTAYHNGGTGADRKLVNGVASDGLCFTDGRPAAESRVQVEVSRQTEWDLVLIPAWTLTVGSEAVSRYEVVPVATPTPTASP